MAALLLAAGAARQALGAAAFAIMIHQPLGGSQGQATDIEIYTKEFWRCAPC